MIHIALGEQGQAFEWLQKAYQDQSAWLVYLRVDPYFDPVRSDPKFIDLVRRLKFPSEAVPDAIRVSGAAQTSAKQTTPGLPSVTPTAPAPAPPVPAPTTAAAPSQAIEATPAPAPVIQSLTVTLADGLPIRVALAADVPADADIGLPLRFQAMEDFHAQGVLVIRKGATISGEISAAPKKKLFGIGGAKLSFTLKKADAAGGQTINLRAAPAKRSDGPAQRAVETGTRPGSKGVAASQGTVYIGYIDGAQSVSVPKK